TAARLDAPMVAFDLPGVGGSDGLTPRQHEELITKKSAREIAASMLRIAETFGASSYKIIGASVGAQVGAEFAQLAGESGKPVEKMVTVCGTGLKEFTTGELFDASLAEGGFAEIYATVPFDRTMREWNYLDAPWIIDKGETMVWLLR